MSSSTHRPTLSTNHNPGNNQTLTSVTVKPEMHIEYPQNVLSSTSYELGAPTSSLPQNPDKNSGVQMQFPITGINFSSQVPLVGHQISLPVVLPNANGQLCSVLPQLYRQEDMTFSSSVNISHKANGMHQRDFNLQSRSTPYSRPINKRTNFTREQKAALMDRFEKHPLIEKDEREELSVIIGVPQQAIKTFFQNERARRKRQKKIEDDLAIAFNSQTYG